MPYYSRMILNSCYDQLFPKLFCHNRHLPTATLVFYMYVTNSVCILYVHTSLTNDIYRLYESKIHWSEFMVQICSEEIRIKDILITLTI